jgi:polysaccharide export outer membrane protein
MGQSAFKHCSEVGLVIVRSKGCYKTGRRRLKHGALASTVALMLAGCAMLPSSGPSTRAIKSEAGSESAVNAPVQIVDVNEAVARSLLAATSATSFSAALGDGIPVGSIVGKGDVLDIAIWEAPPAALFGAFVAGDPSLSSAMAGAPLIARNGALPEQMVGVDGMIRVPFAGTIPAAGRTLQQIAAEIQARLKGKAHDPQVIVRLARNVATNVTVVGEVANSVRMPLTAKGERLLDALASAGGVRQPVGKMTIQITRGDRVDAMPLSAVIRDPQQNIRLQADDVVTLLFQPYSFTVLGAARKNEEVPFEGTGLTLSQALGRVGGLEDQRADPRGVFIFRFEKPQHFEQNGQGLALTPEGRVPVIYRVDMRNPATLFVAQSFPIKDKDVIYISNAPLADFSKFLQAVSQIVYPIATIQNTNIF